MATTTEYCDHIRANAELVQVNDFGYHYAIPRKFGFSDPGILATALRQTWNIPDGVRISVKLSDNEPDTFRATIGFTGRNAE